jgi:hypothetical protein
MACGRRGKRNTRPPTVSSVLLSMTGQEHIDEAHAPIECCYDALDYRPLREVI